MHLYLIRHGEAESNLPDWKTTQIVDTALTARGHRQAEAAAQWVKTNLPKPDAIYSSTLLRTRQTAVQFEQAMEIEAVFDDRIREIGNNYSDHTPILHDTAMISYNDYWATEFPFSPAVNSINGENLLHFRARLGMFLHEVTGKHRDQMVVVICHGFVVDAMLDLAFNVGAHRNCEVWTSNTGITHLQYIAHPGRERWRLHYQNRVEHLAKVGGLGLTLRGEMSAHD